MSPLMVNEIGQMVVHDTLGATNTMYPVRALTNPTCLVVELQSD
jgi:hypothetical protein